MSIGIDYTPAYQQGGGIGRYVRELVAALAVLDHATPYRLFVAGYSAAQPLPAFPANFTAAATRLNSEWLARLWQRLRLPIPIETITGRLDLFHATDFVLPPTRKRTRTLLTVHDLSFVRVPGAAFPRLKAYLDQVVPRSVSRADHILADSQATKDDLIALYSTAPDKITVLLSGVNPTFQPVRDSAALQAVRAKYAIPDRPYLLSVGTVQPRKNYERLIRALAQLRAEGTDIGLVIVGGKGWLEDPIYQTINELQMGDYVRFTGFAAESDLPTLYSAAHCLAFPSLYEGFGLPILEAMSCGIPVMTANLSSLPEVAGEAALLVNPLDQEAINDSLRRLIHDSPLRDELVKRGFEQVSRFTWANAAQQLQHIYRTQLAL